MGVPFLRSDLVCHLLDLLQMNLNEQDKFKVDRWDLDLSGFCIHHGQHTDKHGDCLMCLSLPDYRTEAEMKARKSFNQKLREYEDRCFNEWSKEQDERFRDEESYLAWCREQEEEDHKIQAWEDRRGK